MVQTYYNYISVLAFLNIYRYENKKEININTLNKYNNALIDEYNNSIDDLEDELDIYFETDENYLNDFLEEYNDYFYLNDQTIYLKNSISFTQLLMELEYKLRAENEISETLISISDNQALKSILKIHTMDYLLIDYSQIEKQLEQTYTRLYTNQDNSKLRTAIKKLMDIKASFFIKLGLIPNYSLEAFRASSGQINYSDEYQSEYTQYPLDKKMWNEMAPTNEEEDYEIDNYTYNLYQYAIFGKKNNLMYPLKIYEDIENFQLKRNMEAEMKEQFNQGLIELEVEDEIIDIDTKEWTIESYDCETENEIFYLNYLNNLNYFLNTYGYNKDLIKSKSRLMYALDCPELRLYDDKKYNETMNHISDVNPKHIDWNYMENEIYFMINELFLKQSDEFTIRKLIFVKTFHDLTHYDSLIDEIDKYKNDHRYELFSSIILNNNQLDNKTIEQGKRYFKSLNDKNRT